MLFASLINHLAVQQIREPHGNLISHGEGEEEKSGGGGRLAASGRVTQFYSPPSLQRISGARCVGAGLEGLFCFCLFLYFYLYIYIYFYIYSIWLGSHLSHQRSVEPGTCLGACKSINNDGRRVQTFHTGACHRTWT